MIYAGKNVQVYKIVVKSAVLNGIEETVKKSWRSQINNDEVLIQHNTTYIHCINDTAYRNKA